MRRPCATPINAAFGNGTGTVTFDVTPREGCAYPVLSEEVVACGRGAVDVRDGTLGGTMFGIVPSVGWIMYPLAPRTSVVELEDCAAAAGLSERLDCGRGAAPPVTFIASTC